MPILNPFDEPQVAARYEAWYTRAGRRADRLEKRLLGQLISHFPSMRTALEIGCSTGHFTRWLTEQGLDATGLDISSSMLAEAKRLGGATFVQGDAIQLPFADHEFDLAALITTLEFVADKELAVAEAVRVARHGLLLGVLNRRSTLAARRWASGQAIWRAAHFFSVGELVRLIENATGSRLQSLQWGTTLWPVPLVKSLPFPWGGFIGMYVQLGETGRLG